ncbi:hypothetical protein C1645_879897 [Glomus cerebriforme]|uniref:Uncharacterized protein n=1 Tax=Glomus cerebriforme TaxID=658196 RepID=A0A397SEQ5_9GLOM|nr:hypothetical protein C1645_879897 [Glomus cerebriforme]
MSNKLLSSQPKRILKLLQVLGIKEELEEDRKKYFNLTVFKEWEEAGKLFEEDEEVLCMKNEKNKVLHGANTQSVDNNTESKSVGTSKCVLTNEPEHKARNTFGFYFSEDHKA